jgi:hypothetical protein
MKRIITYSSLVILGFLSSCVYESSVFSDGDKPMAKVSILTRTDTEKVSYLLPVHVYAFTSSGQCAGYQMLTETDDSLFFTLPAGDYTVYALAGVSSDKYSLPASESASAFSPVVLTDSSTGHVEIETGRADITLDNGENEQLTLTVTRAVAQLKMSISGLPENLTGVKMSFQPLETVLRLDGSFDEEQAKRVSFSLTEKEKGEWHMEDSVFVFPTKNNVSNVTIGIVLTDAEGEHSYSYNATFKIEANYKYKIDAMYKAGTPDISGIITGTDWTEERQYTFDFGEGSGETTEYTPGDFYKNFYIFNVEKTEGETVLTVLTPMSWDLIRLADAEDLMTKYVFDGISNWTFFSEEEARLVNKLGNENLEQLNALMKEHNYSEFDDEYKYLYKDEKGEFKAFPLKESFQTEKFKTGERYNMRGIKKLKAAD